MSSPEEIASVKKARFIYNKPENYEPIYVNGVFGGVTPRGELLSHFFFEYADIPEKEEINVEDGNIVQESRVITHGHEREEGEIVFQRDVKAGLIIPAHQIQSIINWMQEKLDKIMETQAQLREEAENADRESS